MEHGGADQGKKKNKGSICVTGGTGFMGSWLVMRLLQDGYSVNTTVRLHPEKNKDLSFLENLPGAAERLKIFDADLDEPESFVPAIEGCSGVFHVAHPVDFEGREPEETQVRRAVEGTLGILKACLGSKTVRRVVYTSSACTLQSFEQEDKGSGSVVDEGEWVDLDQVRAAKPFGLPYIVSKTLTEKAALEFAEKHGLDLVTVIPTIIHGPFVCPFFAGSVHASMALILGEKHFYGILNKAYFVHVDDVANAHIFLFEHPDAKGRYICCALRVTIEELVEFLSARYPQYQMPPIDSLQEFKGPKLCEVSSKKLLDAGFKYNYGLEEMFDGAIQSCKEKGYL